MAMPRRQLTLLDAVSLIVGVIVGAGIYECAPTVAGATSSTWGVLGLWLLGGLLSLMGAMCYAELATAYPRAGGDYVYLTKAYGPSAGFLFGWFQLSIVRPGDIASLALIFGHHGHEFLTAVLPSVAQRSSVPLLALAAVVGLTLINSLGVKFGKWTQNLLTAAKIIGIVFVVAVALSFVPQVSGSGAAATATAQAVQPSVPWQLAIILVLFTFGGWNEMAFLAAEIRDPQKNILRGMMIGPALVTALYLLMNVAFLHALGHAGLASSTAVAQDAVGSRFPTLGGPLINALICVSSLGAVSGLVFTGSRISYALGRDYRLFAWIGQWHARHETPQRALLVQCLLAGSLVMIFGEFVETLIYTSAAVYAFYTATCLSVLVLRVRDAQTPRPYRVTGYPVTVIVFACTSAYLMYSALTYRPRHALALLGFLVVGVGLYAWHRRFGRPLTEIPASEAE